MNETQETVGRWADSTFGQSEPTNSARALRALKEMVELCLAAGASEDDVYVTATTAAEASRKYVGRRYLEPGPDPEKVPGEAADVLIVLYTLAHTHGFDLLSEVDRKMAVNRHEREWVSNGDGTGYHKNKTT